MEQGTVGDDEVTGERETREVEGESGGHEKRVNMSSGRSKGL